MFTSTVLHILRTSRARSWSFLLLHVYVWFWRIPICIGRTCIRTRIRARFATLTRFFRSGTTFLSLKVHFFLLYAFFNVFIDLMDHLIKANLDFFILAMAHPNVWDAISDLIDCLHVITRVIWWARSGRTRSAFLSVAICNFHSNLAWRSPHHILVTLVHFNCDLVTKGLVPS